MTVPMTLVEVMKRLRDPQNGCPWDLSQTHESLMPYLLEETFEVRDALLQKGQDSDEFLEELGDLLFQVVFHAQLLSERRGISFEQIADKCAQKLIKRHPHVFDPSHPGFESPAQVNSQWETLKAVKASAATKVASVPSDLPALQRAYRIGEKASSLGFAWPSSQEAWQKVTEELGELQSAPDKAAREMELGDLLFALAQWSRMEGIEPEWAASKANLKFLRRFERVDQLALEQGKDLKSLDQSELLALWEKSKSVDSGL